MKARISRRQRKSRIAERAGKSNTPEKERCTNIYIIPAEDQSSAENGKETPTVIAKTPEKSENI